MQRRSDTDAEFTDFLTARSGQLYRSAYLLTTSPHAAEDLLQTALAKTYAAWGRVRRADDPVAYVHGVLIKTFLSERRRSAAAPSCRSPTRRCWGGPIGCLARPIPPTA